MLFKSGIVATTAATIFFLLVVSACENVSYGPPPMNAAVVRAGAVDHVAEQQLRDGRTLFVSRCIACHTLPQVAHYPVRAWPHIVDHMAKRANLKAGEREALVSYLVAVRKTL
jgi:cytochrome c5